MSGPDSNALVGAGAASGLSAYPHPVVDFAVEYVSIKSTGMSNILVTRAKFIFIAAAVVIAAIFSFPIKADACTAGFIGSDCGFWKAIGSVFIRDSNAAQPERFIPPQPPTAPPSLAAVGETGKSCAEDYAIYSPEWETCVDNLNKIYSTFPITVTQISRFEISCGEDYKQGTLEFDRCVDNLTKVYSKPRITQAQVMGYEDSCADDYKDGSPEHRRCVDNLINVYSPTTVTITREQLGRFETSCEADYEEGSREYRQCVDNLIKLYAPPPVAKEPATWPELPDSAYVPLPKTTARQTTECLEAYQDGEITYEELIACIPEPKKADIPSSDVNVQTITGLPARVDEISVSPSAVGDYDISNRSAWCESYDEDGNCAGYRGFSSTPLATPLLDVRAMGAAERTEQEGSIWSTLGSWIKPGLIDRVLGRSEPVQTFRQPYNPNLESWRGIKLDDNPQTLDVLEGLESQQGPELVSPAPQLEPVLEDTWYFTPGPYDQRVYYSEGDDYEKIYRNPLLTY